MAQRKKGKAKGKAKAARKRGAAKKPARRPARKKAATRAADRRLATLEAENRRLKDEIAGLRARLEGQEGAAPAFNLTADEISEPA